jgi:hypothetical protein
MAAGERTFGSRPIRGGAVAAGGADGQRPRPRRRRRASADDGASLRHRLPNIELVRNHSPRGVGKADFGTTSVIASIASAAFAIMPIAATAAAKPRADCKKVHLSMMGFHRSIPALQSRFALELILARPQRDTTCPENQGLVGCLQAIPFSAKCAASSPDWSISRTMSQPPMNSPLT